jgi:hypothetical protein
VTSTPASVINQQITIPVQWPATRVVGGNGYYLVSVPASGGYTINFTIRSSGGTGDVVLHLTDPSTDWIRAGVIYS